MKINKTTLAGVLVVVIVSAAFWAAYRHQKRDISVDIPQTTFLAMPQGFKIENDQDVEKSINTDKVKSIFAYYDDGNGQPEYVEELGLTVTKFHGTLKPVQSEIKLFVSTTTDTSGNFVVKPVLNWDAAEKATKIVQVTIKGNVLEIPPTYTLEINPTRPILPKGYITALDCADHVALEQMEAVEVAVKSSGKSHSISHGEKVTGTNLFNLTNQFASCIFGKYQVVLDLQMRSPEIKHISFTPASTADFHYGPGTQTLTIIKAEQGSATVRFIGKELEIPVSSWALYDEWTAFQFKGRDHTTGDAIISMMTIPDEAIQKSGVRLRFKEPPPGPPPHPDISVTALPTIPRAVLDDFNQDIADKASLRLPTKQPVAQMLTCFYDPEEQSNACIKLQLIIFGGDSTNDTAIRGKTSSSLAGVKAERQVYFLRNDGSQPEILSEDRMGNDVIYNLSGVRKGDIAAVAGIYPHSLVSSKSDTNYLGQWLYRDWTAVEVKDLSALGGVDYYCLLGARSNHIRLIGQKDFWLENNQRQYGDHVVNSMSLPDDLPPELLGALSKITLQAATYFTNAPYRAAFSNLASNIFKTNFWSTDHSPKQIRNVVYFTEALK